MRQGRQGKRRGQQQVAAAGCAALLRWVVALRDGMATCPETESSSASLVPLPDPAPAELPACLLHPHRCKAVGEFKQHLALLVDVNAALEARRGIIKRLERDQAACQMARDLKG